MNTHIVQLGEIEFCEDCGKRIWVRMHEYQGKIICTHCLDLRAEAENVQMQPIVYHDQPVITVDANGCFGVLPYHERSFYEKIQSEK